MTRGVGALALSVVLLGLVGAPPASAKGRSSKCGKGTVQIEVGKKRSCVARKLALPPPSNSNALVAGVQGALEFTNLSFKTRSGRRVASFSQLLGPSWATVRGRMENALSVTIARAQSTARMPVVAFATASSADSRGCAVADVIDDYGLDPGLNLTKANSSATVDGVNVTMNVGSSGANIGINATVQGKTFTLKYESGEFSCLAYKLPPCPDGDGSLNAYGIKGKTGFSMTVAEGGKVLKSEKYAKTITEETRGQVAEDAKLDYVDVKYGETTNVVLDGVKLTQYGNRTTRINMRTGGYDPGESVSFGSAGVGGTAVNVDGVAADAKDFSAFVSETMSAYRDREKAWQTPNTCARLTFDPASGTLTVNAGDQGSFSAEATATANGERAAKASWTLEAQRNGTFSPTSSKDAQPSFSYVASTSPSGETMSVTVKATSTAGVVQETWSQKLFAIRTISGSFTGHEELEGISYDWSGTATFSRNLSEPGGVVFSLTSGQATVDVSGTGPSGCVHSGTEQIPLFPSGPLSVLGTGKPSQYTIIAPFDTSYRGGGVTESCPSQPPTQTTEIPPAAALQSGDLASGTNPAGALKTTDDGVTFAGSASEDNVVFGPTSWSWSLKGSP